MTKREWRRIVMAVAATTALGGALAGAQGSEKPKRARPPKWSADVLDVFFVDAREKLVGERPDYGRVSTPIVGPSNGRESFPTADAARATDGWSQAIDAETIETEIKRLSQAIAGEVTTLGAFKSNGFKECRRDFSLLAVLFAVDAEYDGRVRWQDVAAGLREQFTRAGYNSKVGTDQTYQEAVRRKQDLADLVSGLRPQVPTAERRVEIWSKVSDRPPLMQRMNVAHEERLIKWLANEREFGKHVDDVRHEAQIVAMIAGVIARKEFDYWDDEQFAGYAKELQAAAMEVSAAADDADNFLRAQQAVVRVTKACADCHNGYRG